MVAAQSPGSPAARASVCAAVGTMKSRFTVISGSEIRRHGETAIILSLTASLKMAATTRWASRTRAGAQALAAHHSDQGLDVLAPDAAERLVPERRVDVRVEH
jgi:hypothetical protein